MTEGEGLPVGETVIPWTRIVSVRDVSALASAAGTSRSRIELFLDDGSVVPLVDPSAETRQSLKTHVPGAFSRRWLEWRLVACILLAQVGALLSGQSPLPEAPYAFWLTTAGGVVVGWIWERRARASWSKYVKREK